MNTFGKHLFRAALFTSALLAAGLVSAATPEPLGFKGIVLGSDLAQLRADHRIECRSACAPSADRICNLRPHERETLAGDPVSSVFWFYWRDRLTSISINLEEKHFGKAVEALSQKYGKPTLKTEMVRNHQDSAFENRTYTWKHANGSLTAQRYSGMLNRSTIRFADDAVIQAIAVQRDKAVRDSHQDL